MFTLMSTILPIFFLIVLGIVIFNFMQGIKQWNHNNKQPLLTVRSKVVTKRELCLDLIINTREREIIIRRVAIIFDIMRLKVGSSRAYTKLKRFWDNS
ncbi:DUF2500 family protein [Bacillus solitudinis]|uniref:DUF2500 family protein n=1 Tax=Bacillus solitudinis TaxID=2014074 RepID=UPI000C24A18A